MPFGCILIMMTDNEASFGPVQIGSLSHSLPHWLGCFPAPRVGLRSKLIKPHLKPCVKKPSLLSSHSCICFMHSPTEVNRQTCKTGMSALIQPSRCRQVEIPQTHLCHDKPQLHAYHVHHWPFFFFSESIFSYWTYNLYSNTRNKCWLIKIVYF